MSRMPHADTCPGQIQVLLGPREVRRRGKHANLYFHPTGLTAPWSSNGQPISLHCAFNERLHQNREEVSPSSPEQAEGENTLVPKLRFQTKPRQIFGLKMLIPQISPLSSKHNFHKLHAEQTFPGLSCSFRTKIIPPAYALLSALPSPSATNHQRTAQEPPGREFAC